MFIVFCFEKEPVGMVLRILDLEKTFKLHDWFKSYNDINDAFLSMIN